MTLGEALEIDAENIDSLDANFIKDKINKLKERASGGDKDAKAKLKFVKDMFPQLAPLFELPAQIELVTQTVSTVQSIIEDAKMAIDSFVPVMGPTAASVLIQQKLGLIQKELDTQIKNAPKTVMGIILDIDIPV